MSINAAEDADMSVLAVARHEGGMEETWVLIGIDIDISYSCLQ